MRISRIIDFGEKSGQGRNLIFFLVCWPFFLYAQDAIDTAELNEINTRIEIHLNGGAKDSLMYYHQLKIDLFRQADDLAGWVNTYLDLSLLDPVTTLPFLDTMQAQRWRAPRDSIEKEALIWCYMYQGYYLKEANEVWGSAQAYEKALEWYADFSPEGFDILEWVIKPLGNHYTRLGENEKAVHLFLEALGFASGKYSSNALAGLYSNLGLAYWNQGEFDLAIEQYQKGLGLTALSLRNRALLLSNLAGSYFDNGDAQEAGSAARRADRLLTELCRKNPVDPQLLSWNSGNKKMLGRIYLEEKNYEKAAQSFEQALAIGKKASQGNISRQLGKIYLELGKLRQLEGLSDQAIINYNRALSAVLPAYQPQQAMENPLARDLYEENTIFEALQAKADVLLKKYEKEPDPTYLKFSLECHQLASQVEHLLRQTYQYRSSKLRLQEYSRQRSEQAIEVAHLLYLKTKDPAYIIRAFNFAEQNKATVLLETVKKNLALKKLGLRDSLFFAEQRLKNIQADFTRKILEAELNGSTADEIEQLKAQRRTISSRLSDCTQLIEKTYPSLKQIKAQFTPVLYPALQQALLEEKSEMLAFFEGSEAIYRFRIPAEGPPEMKRILLEDSVRTLLGSFRKYFNASKVIASDPDGFLSMAFEVYQLLIGTFGSSNQDQLKKRLIIPDGQLHFIPFEALLTAEPEGVHLARAPYFIKDGPVYYTYSATLWHTQQGSKPASDGSLLAIAPVFSEGSQSLPVLEHSDRSAREIASYFQNSQLLVGEEAGIGRFREMASKYQVLHLATHASSSGEQGSPNIAFFDSTLYLPEIYALTLSADLVVLSACETGLGEIQPGEGIMSLARSFFYAGADGLVSSLWKANDLTTSNLFLKFYGKLAEKESISSALQRAKLDYLNDPDIGDAQKSPYYWAGFVFIGQDQVVGLRADQSFPVWFWGALAGSLLILGGFYVKKRLKGKGFYR